MDAPLSGDARARKVRELAGIRPLSELRAARAQTGRQSCEGFTVVRQQFTLPGGVTWPTVSLLPGKTTGAPVLVLAAGGRTQAVETVTACLAAGQPVMTADLTAVGEVGACKHRFYGSKYADEGVGVMLYLLGESLVGRQAEEILVCARAHAAAHGGAPVVLHARGGLAVAAAHAFAAEPALFAKLELADAPLAWSEVVRRADRFSFALCVQNALRAYDWTDLCAPAR